MTLAEEAPSADTLSGLVNARSSSRRLATTIVDALKARGHVLVVKGGATALTRELDELMAEPLAKIEPMLMPIEVVGEVTSTFGDDEIDETIETIVRRLTRKLMDSDHVEDVFAEDRVIRRDIFRTLRDELLVFGTDDPGEVRIPLDALGYIPGTVSRRADEATTKAALERAANQASAALLAYDGVAREAVLRLAPEADPDDARRALDEAIADELARLADEGIVELPSIERLLPLPSRLTAAELKTARARIDALLERSFVARGCAVAWDFAEPSSAGVPRIAVHVTPLSEEEARDIERTMATFAGELEALFAPVTPPLAARKPTKKAPVRAAEEAKPSSRRRMKTDAPASSRRTADTTEADAKKRAAAPRKLAAKKR